MKPAKLTLLALEQLAETATTIPDLFEATIRAGYGASLSKMEFEFSKIQQQRERSAAERMQEEKLRKRHYEMLRHLRKQGFIEARIRKDKKVLAITKKGLQKLKLLKENQDGWLPQKRYEKRVTIGSNFIIVAFDIPETKRRMRGWIRDALKNLGMKMIQKSVWFGKVKIPEEFLKDLQRLKIIEYIEIFEITRRGTLERMD